LPANDSPASRPVTNLEFRPDGGYSVVEQGCDYFGMRSGAWQARDGGLATENAFAISDGGEITVFGPFVLGGLVSTWLAGGLCRSGACDGGTTYYACLPPGFDGGPY